MATPAPSAIIEFFQLRPDLTAEMLRLHVDDGTGHCHGCSWQDAARPVSPCTIRWYAEQAAPQRQR